MRISDGQTDEDSLAAFGAEAAHLLCSGNLEGLADRFGYALAHDRDTAAAIREDLSACLAEMQARALGPATERLSTRVKYFAPNDAALFALVECLVPTDTRDQLLIELIITSNGVDKFVTLEQISGAA